MFFTFLVSLCRLSLGCRLRKLGHEPDRRNDLIELEVRLNVDCAQECARTTRMLPHLDLGISQWIARPEHGTGSIGRIAVLEKPSVQQSSHLFGSRETADLVTNYDLDVVAQTVRRREYTEVVSTAGH